jgi:16S rRNA (guanine527-N7)-methyltransferase
MEYILKYFPDISEQQRDRFSMLEGLYEDWNSKINVISRKDIGKLYLHHVLHSLAIAKVIEFAKNTTVIDIGTGGGFPGIPLAILFPDCKFHLVDSVGKKIVVAQSVADSLALSNVTTQKARVEELNGKFDFAVTRAVAPMPEIMKWSKKLVRPGGLNTLTNGVIALKGGELKDELAPYRKIVERWPITQFFKDNYFDGKLVVFVPVY